MTEIYNISFKPADIKAFVEEGLTIFKAAEDNEIFLRSDCGQKGTCGKCRVIVNNHENLSSQTRTEQQILSSSKSPASYRLACQSKISGPVEITIPEDLILKNKVYGKKKIQGSFSVNPAVKRILITPEALKQQISQGLYSLSEIICSNLEKNRTQNLELSRLEALKTLSNMDIRSHGITLVNHYSIGVTSVHEGLHKDSLGVAFDIGTTTLAAYLCNLGTGKILTSMALLNPQRQFGEDVISRIAAISKDPFNLKVQQKLVANAMNEMIQSCIEITGLSKNDIDEITVVGNTTMEHILAGFNPKSIGVSPYLPVKCSSFVTEAKNIGLDLMPDTPTYFFPVVSGFLGGDIISALLADNSYKRNESTLIIDIGTNGELLLCCGSDIWATSCATGPALEGAHLSCGMRASQGAISSVFFDPEAENRITFQTIGNKKPAGICGSGIIDALAAMRKAEITLANGTFNADLTHKIDRDKTGGKSFTIPGSDISISLKDVRQVQLAKAALYVGIVSLLKKAGIKTPDRTILTGAFGARFNWKNARDIGMLPNQVCKNKIESVQSLAGKGAVTALLNKSKRNEIESIARTINFLDLSLEPDFTEQFSCATQFPEL